MGRAVVIGGGFAGLASAARLAKQGHQVTVVSPEVGGALNPFEADGFSWDVISTTLLPAVTRDLFRKSGRPLERELELDHAEVIREHRWPDGESRILNGVSRAAQIAELGDEWADHVSSYTQLWEETRHHLFETRSAVLPTHLVKQLRSHRSLKGKLRRDFTNFRLRDMAAAPFELAGHRVRDVPAWAGLPVYLEQRFGAWRPRGGMVELRDALVTRMATRKVEIVTALATDVVIERGAAVGVTTTAGPLDADHVVVAIDPRGLPSIAKMASKTNPVIPPTIAYLALHAGAPTLDHEVVVHGSPLISIRPHGRGPEGTQAWTVLIQGNMSGPAWAMLRHRGIGIERDHVIAEHLHTPAQSVARWHGSPNGVAWQGRSTHFLRLGPRTPIANLYAAGASSISGDGLPFAGLSAALVAAAIGTAPRV